MNTEDYLKELIALDPSLAEHESELKKLLPKLLAAKPTIEPSQEFIQTLRTHLIVPSKPFTMNSQFRLVLGATALAVVVLGTGSAVLMRNRPSKTAVDAVAVGAQAFGRISDLEVNNAKGGLGDSLSAGAEMASSSAAAPTRDTDAGAGSTSSSGSADSLMISPYFSYTYTISDGAIPQLPSNADVLRQLSDGAITDLSLPADLGIRADSSKKKVSNLSFDVDDYMVNISNTGDVNMSLKTQSMVSPMVDRPEIYTQQNYKFDSLLSATQAFFKKYGIIESNYGEPTQGYGGEATATDAQYASVFHPLLIDGKAVYTQWNSKDGVTTTFDQTGKVVQSVYGIRNLHLEKSSYPLVTAKADLEKKLSADSRGVYPMSAAADSKEIAYPTEEIKQTKLARSLSNGQLVYMRKDTYESYTSRTYYVPALRFAVDGATEAYEPKFVTVSLVE